MQLVEHDILTLDQADRFNGDRALAHGAPGAGRAVLNASSGRNLCLDFDSVDPGAEVIYDEIEAVSVHRLEDELDFLWRNCVILGKPAGGYGKRLVRVANDDFARKGRAAVDKDLDHSVRSSHRGILRAARALDQGVRIEPALEGHVDKEILLIGGF